MSGGNWKGVINQILYGLIFTADLSDDAAAAMADAMIDGRYLGDGADVYADAIAQSLLYEGPLTDQIETPHSEEGFRDFLRRLGDQLDAQRPTV